ncbi:uncharacterized protein LOC129966227 [Argiope bruennichi]|uniref:uncharacterized protein LOC129966227 n=1 Tax=Argiope bruennichi TaxID=94029 RepID=UPI002494E426|nr:uncharacterized protein LOC129966227 [Argiope bruennichi]
MLKKWKVCAKNIRHCPHKSFNGSCIIKRFKTNNHVGNKFKTAPDKISKIAVERYLTRKVKENPFLSAPKLSIIAEKELEKDVSPSTIRNVLHNSDLNEVKPDKSPSIASEIRLRLKCAKLGLKFARKMQKRIFLAGKVSYLLERANSTFLFLLASFMSGENRILEITMNLKATVKHGDGPVMVRDSCSTTGPRNQHFNERKMDHNVYLYILKKNVEQCVLKFSLSYNW